MVIGQGVPELNIEIQTSMSVHMRATAAMVMPKSFRTLASRLRLQLTSCL